MRLEVVWWHCMTPAPTPESTKRLLPQLQDFQRLLLISVNEQLRLKPEVCIFFTRHIQTSEHQFIFSWVDLYHIMEHDQMFSDFPSLARVIYCDRYSDTVTDFKTSPVRTLMVLF